MVYLKWAAVSTSFLITLKKAHLRIDKKIKNEKLIFHSKIKVKKAILFS